MSDRDSIEMQLTTGDMELIDEGAVAIHRPELATALLRGSETVLRSFVSDILAGVSMDDVSLDESCRIVIKNDAVRLLVERELELAEEDETAGDVTTNVGCKCEVSLV